MSRDRKSRDLTTWPPVPPPCCSFLDLPLPLLPSLPLPLSLRLSQFFALTHISVSSILPAPAASLSLFYSVCSVSSFIIIFSSIFFSLPVSFSPVHVLSQAATLSLYSPFYTSSLLHPSSLLIFPPVFMYLSHLTFFSYLLLP